MTTAPGRRSLVGLGLAGAGLLGGYAAERALIARQRRRPDPSTDFDPALPEARGRTVTTSDGARLRVVEQGHGPPVLLLHGITLSAAIWHFQLPSLAAAGLRAIAFDQRGHGASTIGDAGLGLDRLAADVAEVIAALDLRDVVLVGHSMGGMVALRYLAGDPGAAQGRGPIAGLALVATSANPVVGSGVPGAAALITALRPALARAHWLIRRVPGPSLGTGDLSFLAARVTFGADPSTSQVALTRDVTNAVPVRVAGELLAEIVHFDESAVLADIDLPTAIVVGTNDLMTPVRHARALGAAVGGARVVTLEGCGHMVMLERPAELDAVIRDLARPGPVP